MESCGQEKEGIYVQCLSLLPQPCFPGDDWEAAHPYKVVDESLALLCLCTQLLLHLFNCFLSQPMIFLTFTLPVLSPTTPNWCGGCQWVGAELPCGVKPDNLWTCLTDNAKLHKSLLGLPQYLNRCTERLQATVEKTFLRHSKGIAELLEGMVSTKLHLKVSSWEAMDWMRSLRTWNLWKAFHFILHFL